MGLIDGYCLCLKNSNSTDNCGELFTYADSWRGNFFKHPTTGASLAPGTMDMELALLHWAGWSRFRTSAAFRNLAITGTLPSIDTNRDTSSPTSNTWDNFKSGGLSNAGSAHLHGDTSHRHYDEHSHGHDGNRFNTRYGLDPERAQVNGSYYIDNASGMIHFGKCFFWKNYNNKIH